MSDLSKYEFVAVIKGTQPVSIEESSDMNWTSLPTYTTVSIDIFKDSREVRNVYVEGLDDAEIIKALRIAVSEYEALCRPRRMIIEI
ncbi:hypothetical protein [Paenibacillus sp. Leaf72]|uniref:hypothetical protein n=1 Tax=Paenibacillus sp. Leaf72 TaxID=1736234 RepID=UPI0006FE223A|nr:hypothetical protein [Paenibacillus sp. Leaf72]KQN96853.1 hypothetical protein ASF12_22555 [Paenibacillus sp. Leaf72]